MRPLLVIAGLIAAAVVVAAIIGSIRPNTSAPLVSEQNVDQNKPATPANSPPAQEMLGFDKVKAGAIQATLEIEGKGVITLELYPQAAPKTVAHFEELCRQHFYEGILVHRVEPGFVFQTGDPVSKKLDPANLRGKKTADVGQEFHLGTGGSGKTVPLEARLPHEKYSLGLARSSAEDSGDSQFYINLNDNHNLDGKYCVFGRVISGQDVADRVEIGDRIKRLSIP